MAAPVECIWCFVIILAAFCSTSSSDRTLKLTHVVFRHGNRSPIKAYPSDPYQEDSWPQGFGQLTQEGMRQHYELGKWLRQRYVTETRLLNSSYSRREIHVFSTSYDRTMMSVESNLAGLFPPEGRQMWNEQLPWQPIPVFTVPNDGNYLLVVDASLCPRLKELREEPKKVDVRGDYISKNKDFFNSLAKLAGFDASNVTHTNFSRIADAWYFEIQDGRTLPTWATKDMVDRVLPLLNLSYSSEAHMSDEYFKLCSGTLLNEIVSHLKGITQGTETRKMYMYSGHDDNVAWLLRSLHVFNNLNPPPASAVMVELYQEDDGSYTVDVLFRNTSNPEPFKLQMPATKGPCTLDHFYEITENALLTDAITACKMQKTGANHKSFLPKTWNTGWILVVGATLLAVVVAMAMIVLLFVSIRRRKQLKKARKMHPISFRLLGHAGTDSEDESIFDT